MDELYKYADLVTKDRYKREAAVDDCHSALLLGTVLAQKPEKVLELGVGTGFISKTILHALNFNKYGKLTCVDNFSDYHNDGKQHNIMPEIVEEIKNMGAKFILSSEKEFVISCSSDTYDLLISDADHGSAHLWKEEIFKIVKPDGIMFFHDVCDKGWKLHEYVTYVKDKNIPHYLFNAKTREDEKCERGWLMVINKK